MGWNGDWEIQVFKKILLYSWNVGPHHCTTISQALLGFGVNCCPIFWCFRMRVPSFSGLHTLVFVYLLSSLRSFVEILNMLSSAFLFLSCEFLLLIFFFCPLVGLCERTTFSVDDVSQTSANTYIFSLFAMPQSSLCLSNKEILAISYLHN